MTDITSDRLNELAALADELPEKYRVAAFQELVHLELGGSAPGNRERQVAPPESSASGNNGSSADSQPAWSEGVIGKMPDLDVVASGNRNLQAAWGVVELNNRGEPATPAAIELLVREELGISPEDKDNLSYRLGNGFTPKYTTRKKEGRGFRYEATRAITELFPKESESA